MGALWLLVAELLARNLERDEGWSDAVGNLVFVGLSAAGICGLLRFQQRRFARAQTELEAVARRYATLMGTAPDYIHVLDDEGRLVEANGAFYRSLGHDPEKRPAGLRVTDWDARWSPEEFREKIAGLRGRSAVFEALHRDVAGRLREVEISASAVEVDGRWLLFCVGRDLTERRREELRQARQDRLESLTLLSGGIAHELNNAFAPIVLGAELLRETHPGLSVDARLNSIAGAARRGADVVSRVLTFAHGLDGERLAMDPVALLEALAAELEAEAWPGLEVRREFPADRDAVVLGDAAQLRRTLQDLAVNALDAMLGSGGPKGGVLTLGLRLRELDATEAERLGGLKAGLYAECFVRDTGPGLTAEARRHLFSPFFTTKPVKTGSGLGLATALGVVRSHGGMIEQADPPGGGAEFRVLLPLAAAGVAVMAAQ